MEKFYDETTIFLNEIILNDTNIVFDTLQILPVSPTNEDKNKDKDKDKDKTDEPKDLPRKKFLLTIKKDKQNEFIQYSDNQFKNNLIILYKNLANDNDKIKIADDLLDIYNNLSIDNKKYLIDNNINPIIHINKIFTLNNNETYKIEDNDSIKKEELETYFSEMENIKNSRSTYENKMNRLFELFKPFIDDNDYLNDLNYSKYIPLFDRDAISHCILNNNQDCVDLDNNTINIEKFRLLSNRIFKLNKNRTLTLYNGDNVKLLGYISSFPKNKNFRKFDMSKYYKDIKELQIGDKVKIYFNIINDSIKENNYNINGSISKIKDDKIDIVLDKSIILKDEIKTNKLTYNKSNNFNNFYIYLEDEKDNIYFKKQLIDDLESIAFQFPESEGKVNIKDDPKYQKYLSFILPNITELISYYNNFFNFEDIQEILNNYSYNINNLHKNDIEIIYNKFKSNIEKYENSNKDLIKNLSIIKKSEPTKKEIKLDEINKELLNIDNTQYEEYNKNYIDNINNRILYFNKQKDLGYSHYLKLLITSLENKINDIQDEDFDKQLNNFTDEKKKLESEIKKYKDIECDTIEIHKFYHNENDFNNDEGNQELNDKYVILNTTNGISILYTMKNGSWNRENIIDSNDVDSIKYCDGVYYYKKIKKNICMYDDLESLCQKRDHITNKKKLDIIELQIEIVNDLINFKKSYNSYTKQIKKYDENLKNIINIEPLFEQVKYSKKRKLGNYTGNADYVDVDKIYNNMEQFNEQEYIPIPFLENTKQKDIPYRDTNNFKLIENILYILGFNFKDLEKMHIYNSIDYFSDILLKTTINNYKKKNKEKTKNLDSNEILQLIYKSDDEINKIINRNLILIISSIVVILFQIFYPDIEINITDTELENKYFSIKGYPIDTDKDNKSDKQLYKYVYYIINKKYSDEYDLDNTPKKLKQIINIILKNRNEYESLLKKNKLVIETEQKKLNPKVWSEFRPNLNMKDEPNNNIGKYLYEIFEKINEKNNKLYKNNIFNKPLLLNICCLEKINLQLNYYNYFKDTNINDYLRDIKSSSKLVINEFFINILKNNLRTNFDNSKIFNSNFDTDDKLLDKPEFFNLDYFNYKQKINNIIKSQENKQIKNDKLLMELIENMDDNRKWYSFTKKIKELFDKIIKFTNIHNLEDKDIDSLIIGDLNRYIVSLDDLSNEELMNIKNIQMKFITNRIPTILSKIFNNYYPIKTSKSYLNNEQKEKILSINKNDNLLDFAKNLQDRDEFRDIIFSNKLFNTKINILLLNLKNNGNNEINNITKNLYLLNYIFLVIILYIYSYLIDNNDDSDEFNIDSILDDIDLFINTNNTDANLSSTLRLVADIVSYILTDYRNTIKNQLIDYDDLQSKMDELREKSKMNKLKKQADLNIEDRIIAKQLKDFTGRDDIYNPEATNTLINNGDNPRNDSILDSLNNDQDNDNNFMFDPGEDPDLVVEEIDVEFS